MPSRTRAFAANTGATALYQVLLIAAGFVIPRTVIVNYGSEVNGLVTSLTQFVGYFAVVEAGISGASVFALYRPLNERSWRDVSKVVSAARRFYVQSGAAFLGLVAVLAILYPQVIVVTGLEPWQIGLLALVLGFSGTLDFFLLAKYRSLLTADKKTYVIQLASSVYVILNTVIIVVLANMQVDLVVLYMLAVSPALVRVAIMVVYANRHYPDVEYYAPSKGVSLHQRWDAFFLQVQAAAQDAAPVVIATFTLGSLKLVSVFSVYALVATGCQRVANMLGTGLQALFGEVIVQGDKRVLQRSFKEYELLVHGATAAICGVASALLLPFIQLFTDGVTDADYLDPVLALLIMVNVFVYQIKTPQGLMIISAGLFKETRWRTLTQSLILLVGAVVLSVWFGVHGLVLGVLASNVYRVVDMYIFVAARVTELPAARSVLRATITAVQTLLIALPGVALMPDVVSWWQWSLTAIVLAMWGGLVILATDIVVAPVETRALLSRVRNLIRRSSGDRAKG